MMNSDAASSSSTAQGCARRPRRASTSRSSFWSSACICWRSNGRNTITRSMRLRNSGRNDALTASSMRSARKPSLRAVEADRIAARDGRADVGGEQEDAAPEVDRPAVDVGQPAVVEDLEEEIPDRRGGLLELVQQDDRERVLAHGRDQRRPVPVDVGVGEQALERVAGLVLAHVHAHEAVGRAEHEFGERLRELRLARAGRPDQQEHAQRPGGVVEAGPGDRDALDDAVDGLALAEHALLEERAHIGQRQPDAGIEHRQRQPGGRRQRGQHIGARDLAAALLEHLGAGGRDQPQRVAGSGDARQELLRELVRLGQRVLRRARAALVRGQRVTHDRDRLALAQRADAHDVERARDARAGREQLLELGRPHLAHEADLAVLDVGQQRVQETLRALIVRARVERLVQLRHDPDDAAVAHALDQVQRPALHLPGVDRAGVDARRRGLEDDDAAPGAVERRAQERALADAVVADDQERARRVVLERLAHLLDQLGPVAHEQRLGPVVRRLPERADAAQEIRVDDRVAPGLEGLLEALAEARVLLADELRDRVDDACGNVLERLGGHLLVRAARRDEERELVLVERDLEHAPGRGRSRARRRARAGRRRRTARLRHARVRSALKAQAVNSGRDVVALAQGREPEHDLVLVLARAREIPAG